MKTILSPIDFSDTSINALAFAAEMAKRTNAHLIIMNVQKEDQPASDTGNKLKSIQSEFRKKFNDEFNSEICLANGTLVNAVKDLVEKHKPDLIIMGTNGASGIKRILIGSNTVNVIANTFVPVLVIPEAARYENFQKKGKSKIVLASDLEELNNENALSILKEIACIIIEPKMRVLSVRPKKTHLNPFAKMERKSLLSFFSDKMESKRITVFSDDVISGINFYLGKKDDIGLVAMISRDSGTLIQKHFTHEMASHTQLPLLILHDK